MYIIIIIRLLQEGIYRVDNLDHLVTRLAREVNAEVRPYPLRDVFYKDFIELAICDSQELLRRNPQERIDLFIERFFKTTKK